MRELALVFLKLGTTAFGGPAAHIAMMEQEVVRRRRWLTHEEFLDYLGATSLIPGPNSTELALHIGHAHNGWRGLLVAGACFITPASAIVLLAAWSYVRYRSLPAVDAALYGVQPVIVAIVLHALWTLGRTAVKSWILAGIGIVTLIGAFGGVNELLLLMGAALTMTAFRSRGMCGYSFALGVLSSSAPVVSFGLWPLFLVFLKTGALLFGSGYVLLAFLRADLVQRLQWLSEQQLLDAIVVGQITPGPVFTTATFIGYLLGGLSGAIVATVAIFLPGFIFVALSARIVPRLRASSVAAAILDGVNVASLSLMAAVSWHLARTAVIDPVTAAIGAVSLLLILATGVNVTWLIVGGSLIGWLLRP